MDNKDKIILEKVLKEITFLQADTKDIARENFLNNERLKRSVAMTLINIGELIHILSAEFKKQNKDIPYEQIKATRNIVAHGYQSLNFNVIYNTVKISLPELKSKIELLLKG